LADSAAEPGSASIFARHVLIGHALFDTAKDADQTFFNPVAVADFNGTFFFGDLRRFQVDIGSPLFLGVVTCVGPQAFGDPLSKVAELRIANAVMPKKLSLPSA
jgi:hypothetical protein